MKQWFKRNSGLIYIGVVTLVLVVWLVNSEEFPRVLEALRNLDPFWIRMTGVVMAMYLIIRMLTLYYYVRSRGGKISIFDATIVSGLGQFYSAVTPSAAGGQPFQVLALHQRGVPVSVGTATVSIKFIGFQLAFMIMGVGLWLFRWDMVARQLGGARWLVVLGYLINGTMIIAVVMTMFRSAWVDRCIAWLVRIGAKLRLIKDEQSMFDKARAQMAEYRGSLLALRGHWQTGLCVLVLSMLQILFLMSVIITMYHAFRLSGTDDLTLLTLQFLLFVMASFAPVPGAQEGGFFLFFRGIVPGEMMLPMMLCWRFFTYYLLLIAGIVPVIIDAVQRRLHNDRSEV